MKQGFNGRFELAPFYTWKSNSYCLGVGHSQWSDEPGQFTP